MISKSKFKICRRLGPGIYDKCQTTKFSISGKGSFTRGKRRRKVLSEYGKQLIEKQRIRYSYGISEKQLSNCVKEASKVKGVGMTSKLYSLLESRLDNVIYRLGFAPTRRAARQMVSHGHFLVNGTKVTIPSYRTKIGDKIEIREGSKSKKLWQDLELRLKDYTTPVWLKFDKKKLEGEILSGIDEINPFFDLNAVLEFYSR